MIIFFNFLALLEYNHGLVSVNGLASDSCPSSITIAHCNFCLLCDPSKAMNQEAALLDSIIIDPFFWLKFHFYMLCSI